MCTFTLRYRFKNVKERQLQKEQYRKEAINKGPKQRKQIKQRG